MLLPHCCAANKTVSRIVKKSEMGEAKMIPAPATQARSGFRGV